MPVGIEDLRGKGTHCVEKHSYSDDREDQAWELGDKQKLNFHVHHVHHPLRQARVRF